VHLFLLIEVEGTQYPLHAYLSYLVLFTIRKFSERQIRLFRALPEEAATRYVGSDE
jgi:hypothetical protein